MDPAARLHRAPLQRQERGQALCEERRELVARSETWKEHELAKAFSERGTREATERAEKAEAELAATKAARSLDARDAATDLFCLEAIVTAPEKPDAAALKRDVAALRKRCRLDVLDVVMEE